MLVYIAGPIRGKPDYNQHEFFKAERMFVGIGHDVINPIQLDLDYDGGINEGVNELVYARRDLGILLGLHGAHAPRPIDAIYLLKGWSKSRGAIAEAATARWIGANMWFEDPEETQAVLEKEVY
jgi:hypothetical protein